MTVNLHVCYVVHVFRFIPPDPKQRHAVACVKKQKKVRKYYYNLKKKSQFFYLCQFYCSYLVYFDPDDKEETWPDKVTTRQKTETKSFEREETKKWETKNDEARRDRQEVQKIKGEGRVGRGMIRQWEKLKGGQRWQMYTESQVGEGMVVCLCGLSRWLWVFCGEGLRRACDGLMSVTLWQIFNPEVYHITLPVAIRPLKLCLLCLLVPW